MISVKDFQWNANSEIRQKFENALEKDISSSWLDTVENLEPMLRFTSSYSTNG